MPDAPMNMSSIHPLSQRKILEVGDPLRCSKPGVYPWPCKSNPDRTLQVFGDDVFTRDGDGSYTKHTGLMMKRIQIPDEVMEPWGTDSVQLEMI